jgi:hypothetical protein
MSKKSNGSTNTAERPPIATLDQFDATYLTPDAKAGKADGLDGELGIGLVSHVLRDFRRNLRS